MKQNTDTYRAVKDSFWTDILILDLLPEEKLFYLWLFTNQHLDPCGCYQVAIRTIEYETGFSRDTIAGLIQRFISLGRIDYNEQNREFILLKWKNNNQGFFKAGNVNSVKAIKQGASKIITPEFRQIVLEWLGECEAPTPPPTPPPNQVATPQPLTINHEPIIKDKSKQGAGGHACATERMLREYVDQSRENLTGLFPDADLAMELEEMVAKYRGVTIGADPAVIVIRWLRNLVKARASPKPKSKGVLKQEAAVAASQEALKLVRGLRERDGLGRKGAESTTGSNGDAGHREFDGGEASPVSAGVG